jgi:hypothetical protein
VPRLLLPPIEPRQTGLDLVSTIHYAPARATRSYEPWPLRDQSRALMPVDTVWVGHIEQSLS